MWLFGQCDSWGEIAQNSFPSPNLNFPFQNGHPATQACRQVRARPATTAGNGQNPLCSLETTSSTCSYDLETQTSEIQLPGLHNAHFQQQYKRHRDIRPPYTSRWNSSSMSKRDEHVTNVYFHETKTYDSILGIVGMLWLQIQLTIQRGESYTIQKSNLLHVVRTEWEDGCIPSSQEAFSLGIASARTLILDFILELWTAGWMSVEALYGQSANSLLRTDTSKYKHTT